MQYKSNVQLKREMDEITYDVHQLKKELIHLEPEHFSKTDILRAFFGAIFLGFSFLFSTALINIALTVNATNIVMIIVSTIMLLNAEIYFIGYSRVKNKHERPYGQFFLKRLVAFYGIALIVAFYLSTIFGLLYFVGSFMNLMKLSVIIAMPCAIGAAITDLLRKY